MSSRPASAARGRSSASARIGAAPVSRRARTAKALLVAVSSTLVALISHVLAGGSIPGLVGILVPVTLSVLVCLPLSGRALSLPRLALSVLASQFLFHWLFVLGAAGSTAVVTADRGGVHAGHDTSTIAALASTSAHADHTDGWMWLGHGVAAVATIALIRRSETALAGLRRLALLLAALLARAVAPRLAHAAAIPARAARLVAAAGGAGGLARAALTASVSRRGPPRPVAFALS
ncbi:MAG: hypothetical protein CMF56_07810 [Leifsonia sp.]|nr:hypothetical protein [Leifsonia sp.]|tara:strand:- start:3204 stop:3908 length:705 start_codon:yes stop_codon:yes gene_type:complete